MILVCEAPATLAASMKGLCFRERVWALITLLGYVAVLHARHIGWLGHRGLAALSVVCFSMVMMAR